MDKIQIKEGCQFLIDIDKNTHEGNNRATYHLITCIAGLKLWQVGLKPNRHFTLKAIKNYFGITGNAKQLLYKLEKIKEICQGETP